MTHLAVRMKASSEEQDDEAMRQSLPDQNGVFKWKV